VKPLVAIIGRPNVGKSTFFNRLVGKRISIVEDVPGVTRDRIYADTRWQNHEFTLIDTGGLDLDSDDVFLSSMRQQVDIAVSSADVILYFVDGRTGLTPTDYDVADYIRRSGKPVIPVVNKVDTPSIEKLAYEFYSLGLGDPFCISSVQGLGLGDLLDEVIKYFPEENAGEEKEEKLSIAVVGRPNAGKSSLVNRILGEDRVIVSDIAGTTRDAIDTAFVQDGQNYVIIDTAGMRRKSRVDDMTLERYSVIRALTAVRRADVVVLMVDVDGGISEQDAKIAGYVHEEGKPIIIVANKWDLIEKDDHSMKKYTDAIFSTLSFIPWAPVLFISCKTGQRVDRLLPLVREVYENSQRRISTGLLNDVINDAVAASEPPSHKGQNLRIYYSTQAEVGPPTFIMFVNNADVMHYSYQRYLENYLRKTFNFRGTPIKIVCRNKSGGRDK